MADQLCLEFEEWRKIEDWPAYEVSSLGRVRRATDSGDPRYPKGYVLKPFPNTDGYPSIKIGPKRHQTTLRVHTLVCRAFNGPAPEGKPEAAHWDGNPTNNIPSNLRWTSHAENMADLARHGKHRGEKHRRAIFTEDQVRAIRARLGNGEPQIAIARDLGVSQGAIHGISRGNWGWLK